MNAEELENIEENKKNGYISLHRSMLEWEWFQDVKTCHLFIYCLLKANHKDKKYKGALIKRGSFVTSLEILAKETGLTPQNIRTSLNKLKSTNELTNETSTKGRIITIVKYDFYQTLTNKLTSNQQTTNKQLTTNNNINNINNENNVVVGATAPPPTTTTYPLNFEKFWKAFKKKGNKKDTFIEFQKHNFTDEDMELLIYASNQYSIENSANVSMMYSRTFLENEKFLDYEDKFIKHKRKEKEKEELKEIKKRALTYYE